MKTVYVELRFTEKNWKKFRRIMGIKPNEEDSGEGLAQGMTQSLVDDWLNRFKRKPKFKARRKMQI
jgi:hypothetical protein